MNATQTLFAWNTSPKKPMTRWKFFWLTLLLVLLWWWLIAVITIPFIYAFIITAVFTFSLGIWIFEPWFDKIIIFCGLVLIGFLCWLYFVFKKRYEYIFGKNLWIEIILWVFFGTSVIGLWCEIFLKQKFVLVEWGTLYFYVFLVLFIVWLVLNPKTTTTSDGFLQVTHLNIKNVSFSFDWFLKKFPPFCSVKIFNQ